MANCDNPKTGRDFESLVYDLIRKYYNKEFTYQKAIPIGEPQKVHCFDIVSKDESIVVECKCHTWTATAICPAQRCRF